MVMSMTASRSENASNWTHAHTRTDGGTTRKHNASGLVSRKGRHIATVSGIEVIHIQVA